VSNPTDLTTYPHKLDRKRQQCAAIVDTPKGRRNKFKYDPESNLFRLSGVLPHGMVFPYDFGFIPSTMGGDGDPLDVLALMDEPAHVGCLLDVRLIGVIEAEQSEGGKTAKNDRLLGVPMTPYSADEPESIRDLHTSLLDQIEQFFVSYNLLRGKKFKPTGRRGPKRAMALVEAGIKAFERRR
jgi:inorganic pyrophosphatase